MVATWTGPQGKGMSTGSELGGYKVLLSGDCWCDCIFLELFELLGWSHCAGVVNGVLFGSCNTVAYGA